jgi:hypothetical protein
MLSSTPYSQTPSAVPEHKELKEMFNKNEIDVKKANVLSVEVKTSTMWIYIPREKQRPKISHI